MPSFILNGREVSFDDGETILKVAWREGILIPVFCYHPHLPWFAGCRMCLVEVETERGRTLVPSCVTQAKEGIKVTTDGEKIREVRAGQLEFLLLNHPLECPVCDRGGECDLQDMVFRFGKGDSRFSFHKIRKERRYAGPFLELYPNRCIICYRCVSFYQGIVQGDDWGTVERGEETLVGPLKPGPLLSEFSGNMIEICPLGAITGRDYRFSSRPVEHTVFDSVSPHDSIGANIRVFARIGGPYGRGPIERSGERGEMHRILRVNTRVNPDVNGPWIDDRTRFVHEFVNWPHRLRDPLLREGGRLKSVSWEEAIVRAISGLERIKESYGPGAVGIIAGGSGTNEAAFLLAKLAREAIFTPNIDSRPPFYEHSTDPLYEVLGRSASTAVLKDIETADLVMVFGVDVRNRFPLLGLNLMKAQESGAEVVLLLPYLDRASEGWATRHLQVLPNEYPHAAALLAKHASVLQRVTLEVKGELVLKDELSLRLRGLAEEILSKENPVLVFGDDLGFETEKALALLSVIKEGSKILYLRSFPNGQGFVDQGVHPTLQTGQKRSASSGLSSFSMIKALGKGELKSLILFGTDPLSLFPLRQRVEEALRKAEFVVILDAFETAALSFGDVILPLASHFEEEGTYTNCEGRVQHAERVLGPLGNSRPATEVLSDILNSFGVELSGNPRDIFEVQSSECLPYNHIRYGEREVREESFPLEIPSLRGIREVHRTPLAKYPLSLKIDSLSLPRIEKREGFLIYKGHRLFKSPYALRNALLKEMDEGEGIGISPEDADSLGVRPGDVVVLEKGGLEIETPIHINPDLPRGVLEALWPFSDVALNSLIGLGGYGYAMPKVKIVKESE